VGAADDPSGKSDRAFPEHLMFRGTRDAAGAFSRIIPRRRRDNGSPTEDYTAFYQTLPPTSSISP